ncbi:MAG: TrkA C-terminal domain-containing protein, partial [Acidobacteriota bacterium]
LIVSGVAALLWRKFIRIYSKAQSALEETFAQPPPPRHQESAHPLASLLKEAEVETLTIRAGSRAAGKLIRELALRTQTGASVVALVRNGTTVINPGPDEELLPGSQVLLLGNRAQLDEARRYLAEGPAKL